MCFALLLVKIDNLYLLALYQLRHLLKGGRYNTQYLIDFYYLASHIQGVIVYTIIYKLLIHVVECRQKPSKRT